MPFRTWETEVITGRGHLAQTTSSTVAATASKATAERTMTAQDAAEHRHHKDFAVATGESQQETYCGKSSNKGPLMERSAIASASRESSHACISDNSSHQDEEEKQPKFSKGTRVQRFDKLENRWKVGSIIGFVRYDDDEHILYQTQYETGEVVNLTEAETSKAILLARIKIGTRLAIYWNEAKAYFEATVTKLRNRRACYYVYYDFGEREWVDLEENNFRINNDSCVPILEDSTGKEIAATAGLPAENGKVSASSDSVSINDCIVNNSNMNTNDYEDEHEIKYGEASQVTVGSRVAIYWPEDNDFYEASVIRMREGTNPFFLEFGDGEREWLDLANLRFYFVSDEDELEEDEAALAVEGNDHSASPQTPTGVDGEELADQQTDKVSANDNDGTITLVARIGSGGGSASVAKSGSLTRIASIDGLALKGKNGAKLLSPKRRSRIVGVGDVDHVEFPVMLDGNPQITALSSQPEHTEVFNKVPAIVDQVIAEGEEIMGSIGDDVSQVIVGSKVGVWWPEDDTFYDATVIAINKRRSSFHLHYEDDEEEWLDLRINKFLFLPGSKRSSGYEKKADYKPKRTKKCSNIEFGDSIQVWWDTENRYYDGIVTQTREGTPFVYVVYNDGEQEWLDISKHKYILPPRERVINVRSIDGSGEVIGEGKVSAKKRRTKRIALHNDDKDSGSANSGMVSESSPVTSQRHMDSPPLEIVAPTPVKRKRGRPPKNRNIISHSEDEPGKVLSSAKLTKMSSPDTITTKMPDRNGTIEDEPVGQSGVAQNVKTETSGSQLALKVSTDTSEKSGKKIKTRPVESGDESDDKALVHSCRRGRPPKNRHSIATNTVTTDNALKSVAKKKSKSFGQGDRINKIGIGTRLAVWWEGEQQYFEGSVAKVKPGAKRGYFIRYDDGDKEWIDLSMEKFMLLEYENESDAIESEDPDFSESDSDERGDKGHKKRRTSLAKSLGDESERSGKKFKSSDVFEQDENISIGDSPPAHWTDDDDDSESSPRRRKLLPQESYKGVTVEQIDIVTGKVLKIWPSVNSIATTLDISRSSLKRLLQREGKPYMDGFFWRCRGEKHGPWIPYDFFHKKIEQICISSGDVLNVFDSVSEARKSIGIGKKGLIYDVCVGVRDSAMGFFWRVAGTDALPKSLLGVKKIIEVRNLSDGTVVETLDKVADASRIFGGESPDNIRRWCRTEATAKGYRWNYAFLPY